MLSVTPSSQDLKGFLDQTLKNIVPNDTSRELLLNENAMKIWNVAFTHESCSYEDNNEDLEFLGDAVLKAVFIRYIMKRFPNFTRKEYAELNVNFMSKMKQAELAKNMGLGDYLKKAPYVVVTTNLLGDLFESFFGGLDAVANGIAFGLGGLYCYNMIVFLFRNVKFSKEDTLPHPKTRVTQIFSRFGLKPATIDVTQNAGRTSMQVRAGTDIMNFLRENNVSVRSDVLGEATSNTKKEAEYSAYKAALATLQTKGVNTKWAEKIRRQKDLEGAEIERYLPGVNRRLEKENLEDLEFDTPKKTHDNTSVTVHLVAKSKETGKKKLLLVGTAPQSSARESENTRKKLRLQLLDAYARGAKLVMC